MFMIGEGCLPTFTLSWQPLSSKIGMSYEDRQPYFQDSQKGTFGQKRPTLRDKRILKKWKAANKNVATGVWKYYLLGILVIFRSFLW